MKNNFILNHRFEKIWSPGIKVGSETFTAAKMLEEDMEVAIKMVVVGNGAVGKSSMIQRYCKGIFTKDYKKTIGVDFLERQIQYVLGHFIPSVLICELYLRLSLEY